MGDMTHVYEVKTKLTDKKIFLYELAGEEELGRAFKYTLTLLTTDQFDLQKLLGEPLSVKIQKEDGRPYRYLSGIATEVEGAGESGIHQVIKVTLRPWFWVLTLTSDNLIFQEKTALEIIKQVFSDHGFADYQDKTSATYRKRDYCVQYGETAFEFVSRLMEEEGIYYYFEHADNKHTMVMCDALAAHAKATMADGKQELVFRMPSERTYGQEVVYSWSPRHSLRTQKVSLESYDFENSAAELKGDNVDKQKHPHSGLEKYEYGQLWSKAADGKQLATVRREENAARYQVVDALSNAPGVAAGHLLTLAEHPEKEQNAEYLVTGVRIELRNNEIETLAGEQEDAFYRVAFSSVKSSVQYRSERTTARGAVRGPQTALVVGPKSEEIWTDKMGRIKVQFHWDRKGKKDENSSCWIRVASTWAGSAWGAISIPRVGQEVIVDFLEGDPDQPIVTGSVYNDKNMPPFTLPDNKTQSGIRTRSTKDGTTKTFNELRFEDKKGSEEVYFHAEKDFRRVVENDDHLIVGKDKKDKGDQTVEIHNDRTVTLDEGTDSLTVKKGDRTAKIEKGDDSLDVSAGNQNVKVKKKISIEAGDELHIKVGMSSLTMKKNGDITIKGKNITLDGKGKVTCKALQDFSAQGMNTKIQGKIGAQMSGVQTKVEGKAMLDLKASGMAKLKGSINMIG